jgi:hypothetical protein
MAATFQVVAQYPTLEFLGGTRTQQVMTVGIQTKPSGIYVEFRLPKLIYDDQHVNAAAIGWATIFETIATEDWVGGVEWAQRPTAGGQLQDVAVITVVSSSGNSSDTLTVPVTQLGPKLHQPQITALHEKLDSAEAL